MAVKTIASPPLNEHQYESLRYAVAPLSGWDPRPGGKSRWPPAPNSG
jgi:hypothetical protein